MGIVRNLFAILGVAKLFSIIKSESTVHAILKTVLKNKDNAHTNQNSNLQLDGKHTLEDDKRSLLIGFARRMSGVFVVHIVLTWVVLGTRILELIGHMQDGAKVTVLVALWPCLSSLDPALYCFKVFRMKRERQQFDTLVARMKLRTAQKRLK